MSREARSVRCPESVLGWIPWYGEVDEGGDRLLDDRKRGAVEAHAAECADCRAELDMIAGVPFEIDVDLPDPDRVFAEITARIDAGEADGLDAAPVAPAAPDALSDDEVRRLTRWVLAGEPELETPADEGARVVRGPWRLQPAMVAAAAAAIFLLGVFGGARLDLPFTGARAEYALASVPESGGARLDVVFAEGATAGQIAEGLRAAGLEIVSGPSSVGRYRLRAVGVDGPDADADLQVIASRLKEGPRPLALFAEPVSP